MPNLHDPHPKLLREMARGKDNLPWGCGWVFSARKCAVDSCKRQEPCRGTMAQDILRQPARGEAR